MTEDRKLTMATKLWTLRDGYDYHRQSTWVVMAETQQAAWDRLLKEVPEPKVYIKSLDNDDSDPIRPANISDLQEHDSDVYRDYGCDC